ncbi:MAG: hypothetical protein IKK24_00620 [Clostridia bacterium]|nr:hypothetical protein [Clostridia bacterium]
MKLSKILVSLLLIAAIFVLSMPVAAALPSYNAVKDYSSDKQGSVWRYQIGYNDGKGLYAFSDLEPNKDGTYGNILIGTIGLSSDDMVTTSPTISMHSGDKSDPVLTFVAPHSGTIEVSMANGGVYCPINGQDVSGFDGINFYMCAGSTVAASFEAVSAKNSATGNRVFDKVYKLDIVKGERIYFIVQPNKNTANDTTCISPQIDYVKLSNKKAKSATVPAYIGNRPTSGPTTSGPVVEIVSTVPGTEADGVYKLTEDFAEYMDHWACYWVNGKIFNEMIFRDDMWLGETATSATIAGGGASWHPHISGYNVATFTPPESGRVQVGSECKMSVNASTSDGVNIMVVSDNNVLGKSYYLNAENPEQDFEVIEFDVYKGQEIKFYLDMNMNNSGDSTTFAPFVKYVEYKDVPKSDYEEEVYVEGRFDGTQKTDIEPVGTEETAGAIEWSIKHIVISASAVILLAALITVVCIIIKKKGGKQ